MANIKISGISNIAVAVMLAAILLSLLYFIFTNPVLCDPDSLYNLSISRSINSHGLYYKFDWARFSVLKERFSDRDLVLHLMVAPLLLLFGDPMVAGKAAISLFIVIFLLAYYRILRRYLSSKTASFFLVLPFLSSLFLLYIMQLRSATLSNILLIMWAYAAIERKYAILFAVSMIYPITHISFYILLPIVFLFETLRFVFDKEFCIKNIFITLSGCALGCVIHPNFPNNIFIAYLNGVLLPIYMISGKNIGISGELGSLGMGMSLVLNFTLFAGLILALSLILPRRNKLRYPAAAWFALSSIYLFLALFASKFWYQANTLFFIFLASFIGGLLKDTILEKISSRSYFILAPLIIAAPFFISVNLSYVTKNLEYQNQRGAYYEKAGKWMMKNVPPAKTIYHSHWDDASYFMYFNPKNSYINVGDPIYMYYLYPKELYLMENISMGMVRDPGRAMKKIFGSDFCYVRKTEPLYNQAARETDSFRLGYEDVQGAVFEIL